LNVFGYVVTVIEPLKPWVVLVSLVPNEPLVAHKFEPNVYEMQIVTNASY